MLSPARDTSHPCHLSPVTSCTVGHTMVHSLHSLLVACQDGDTAKVETILQVMEWCYN